MKIYKFYVPWDTDLFLVGIQQLLSSYGAIINVALWGFLIITGIYLVIKIVNSILG